MGYELRGLVARSVVLAAAESRLGLRGVELEQGFTLLPGPFLDPDDAVPGCSWPAGEPFWWLTGVWEAAAVAASSGGSIAYVEAEFFGGVGTQAAVVWELGVVLDGAVYRRGTPVAGDAGDLARWPINRVLRRLGVAAARGCDEFGSLGLGRHRDPEDWARTTRPE